MKSTRPDSRNPSRQAILEAARSRGRFTRADLAQDTGYSSNVVGTQVRRLLDNREIEVFDKVDGREILQMRNMPKLDVSADSVEAALWTAMRTLRRFEPIDLIAALHGTQTVVSIEDARRYCRTLLRAGYLHCVRKAEPGRLEARYLLRLDSGPIAPVLRRVSVLVDPNEQKITWVPEVAR